MISVARPLLENVVTTESRFSFFQLFAAFSKGAEAVGGAPPRRAGEDPELMGSGGAEVTATT